MSKKHFKPRVGDMYTSLDIGNSSYVNDRFYVYSEYPPMASPASFKASEYHINFVILETHTYVPARDRYHRNGSLNACSVFLTVQKIGDKSVTRGLKGVLYDIDIDHAIAAKVLKRIS